MPAKKKNGKAKKEKALEEHGPDSDPAALLSAYLNVCRNLGLSPHESVRRALVGDPENPKAGRQILIESGDDTGTAATGGASSPLGPGGCRALALAIVGGGRNSPPSDVNYGPSVVFTALKELRLWRSDVGDFGAVALADMLRLNGAGLKISFLEVLDDGIGERGALALGRSLSVGVRRCSAMRFLFPRFHTLPVQKEKTHRFLLLYPLHEFSGHHMYLPPDE